MNAPNKKRPLVGLSVVFWTLVIRYYCYRPAAGLLCLLGVSLGIGAAATINMTVERAVDSFVAGIGSMSGRAELQVRFAKSTPPADLSKLRFVWQHGWFSPFIEIEAKTETGSVRLFGFDFIGDRRIRSVVRHRPSTTPGTQALPRAGVFVGEDSTLGKIGSTLQFRVGDERHALPVIETIASINGRRVPADAAFADLSTILPISKGISGVDILPNEGAKRTLLAERIQRAYPSAALINHARSRQDTAQLLGPFRMNLRALAAVAVLVAAFLIFNTMHLTALRRTPEVRTLFALGAHPRTIRAALLLEGFLFAALGGLPGVLLAIGASEQALADTAVTLGSVFGLTGSGGGTSRGLGGLSGAVLTYALALIGAVLAAWAPARAAAGRATARMALAHASEYDGRMPTRVLIGFGICAGLFWLLERAAHLWQSPLPGLLAVVPLLIGISFLAPLTLLAALRPGLSPGAPAVFRLAAAIVQAHIRKASVAVAALAIALCLSGSVSTMVASFRSTVKVWLETVIRADIYIGMQRTGADTPKSIPRHVAEQIRRQPFSGALLTLRSTEQRFRGERITFRGHDFAVLEELQSFSFVSGSLADLKSSGRSGALISEVFANRFGISRGDLLHFAGRKLRVLSVVRMFSSGRGVVMVDQQLYQEMFGYSEPLGLAIVLRAGVPPEQAMRWLNENLGNEGLQFSANRQIREQAMEVFARTFRITDLLRAIAFGTASLSIITTLLAIVMERRRELALLSALGTGRLALQFSLLLEALLIVVAGLLAAVPGIAALSYLLVAIINRYSFGWTIGLDVPWVGLLAGIGWMLLFAVVASLYPLLAAAQSRPAEALREE